MKDEKRNVILVEIHARGYTKKQAIENAQKALKEIEPGDSWFVSSRDTDGLLAYHIETYKKEGA